MPPTVADVSGLLRVLAEHEVRFIVVGGVCAVIHGAPVSTFDLDIVPERSDENAGWSIAPDASRLRGSGHNCS